MNSFKTIAWVTTAIFAVITVVGKGPSTYRYAILFLGPMLWAVYLLRQRLHIHPCHFAIFASALVLHNLGAFGTYGQEYYGLEFDTYVHFTSVWRAVSLWRALSAIALGSTVGKCGREPR